MFGLAYAYTVIPLSSPAAVTCLQLLPSNCRVIFRLGVTSVTPDTWTDTSDNLFRLY
jgi:hypothetical protein